MVNDDVDFETLDVTKLNFPEGGPNIFYLCKNLQNDNSTSKHYFAVRDLKSLKYLNVVHFKAHTELIKCSICNETKEEARYFYCHNDERYFCSTCDEEYHVKPNYKTMQKHRRTLYASFSITHQSTCMEHLLKPNEFYCHNCKAVFCIKCLNEGHHSNFQDHDVKFLNDVFSAYEQESKSLVEKMKQINMNISTELDNKEKSAKDIHKLITELETKVKDIRRNLTEEAEMEALMRSTNLIGVQFEISRLLIDLDSKINFIRNQFINADHSTYINLTHTFSEYLKKDLLNQLDLVTSIDLENLEDPIIPSNYNIEHEVKKPKVNFA
jgi:hypothetical protein